jgi:hypothetical protein
MATESWDRVGHPPYDIFAQIRKEVIHDVYSKHAVRRRVPATSSRTRFARTSAMPRQGRAAAPLP